MIKRSIPILFILVLLLAACAPLVPQPIAADQAAPPTNPPADIEFAVPEDTPIPTATLVPTATATPLGDEITLLTNEPPDILLTAVNLQLEQNHIRMTEAANQISTLSADTNQLETQVAVSKTQAASDEESGNEDSNVPSNGNYKIPSNVTTVVTIDSKTYVFIESSQNKNGAPIMGFYEPRVFLTAGTEAWVYKTPVKVDGGELYYESYDPDGQAPKFKIYFRGKHIQLRTSSSKYPSNVAKAKVTTKIAVHTIVGYDNKDKPVMDTYKPYIHYQVGDTVILYPKYVVATGGSHWYPIYDSDGKPSGYIPTNRVTFLSEW